MRTEFLGTSNNGGAAIKAILVANGVPAVDSAQFFTNAIDTRTRGLDVVAEYTLRTSGLGIFRTSAAYSLNRTKILRIRDNPEELNNLNVVLFGRQAQLDLRFSTPRDKIVLNTDWSLEPVRINARLSRYGRYLEAGTTAVGDRSFGAKWVADLDIGVELGERVTLAVGANNLFDAYPDRNGIIASDGSGQYGGFAPFGLSGGFYYGRVAVRF